MVRIDEDRRRCFPPWYLHSLRQPRRIALRWPFGPPIFPLHLLLHNAPFWLPRLVRGSIWRLPQDSLAIASSKASRHRLAPGFPRANTPLGDCVCRPSDMNPRAIPIEKIPRFIPHTNPTPPDHSDRMQPPHNPSIVSSILTGPTSQPYPSALLPFFTMPYFTTLLHR